MMLKLVSILWQLIALKFRSRRSLEAEVVVLRQQLSVARVRAPKRIRVGFWDQLILVLLYRRSLSLPKTLSVRW